MKSHPRPSETAATLASELVTFSIVAGCSILFCSKGIVAKLAYRQGVDALNIVTLRMVISLPFFVIIAVWSSRGAPPLHARDLAALTGLGFLGYYLSSLVNFTGLQYVSVGLERIILYTYPTLVLVFSKFFLHQPVRPSLWFACAGAWLGIVAAFTGELHHPASTGKTSLGAALVFASALTYAWFLMLSGKTIQRVGANRFTGIVVGISCLLMMTHFAVRRPLSSLLDLPAPVYGHGAILALFGTVAPAVLMSHGLRRAGPLKFSVISTIGPVTTVLLAWAMLGERPNASQSFGFALTVCSGLALSLWKNQPPKTSG